MKDIYNSKKNNIFFVILLTSVIIFLPKWIISFSFFNEDITLRIINEVSDAAYFPIINSFSDFNFSNSYSNNIEDLKLISYPIIGLFINSLFFKLLGSYSFIFLELTCIFFFLLIFFNIFLFLIFLNYLLLLFRSFCLFYPPFLKN